VFAWIIQSMSAGVFAAGVDRPNNPHLGLLHQGGF
jgi:hypothetical protein